jgi:hypothetical protein
MTQNTKKPGDTSNTKTQNSWTTTASGQTNARKNTDKSPKQTTKGEWQESGSTSWNASPAGQGKSGSVTKNK